MNSGDITICAREHVLSSPYGVIEVEGILFKSMTEKPSFNQLVNAGIYVINSKHFLEIPHNHFFTMPELFNKLREKKLLVAAYTLKEKWTDIGRLEDLDKFAN